MTREDFQNYADLVLMGYMPLTESEGIYEINNGLHLVLMNELKALLRNSTFNIEQEIKNEIAEATSERLHKYFNQIIVQTLI